MPFVKEMGERGREREGWRGREREGWRGSKRGRKGEDFRGRGGGRWWGEKYKEAKTKVRFENSVLEWMGM